MAQSFPPDQFDSLEYEVATGDIDIVQERVERILRQEESISKCSWLLKVAITCNHTTVLQYLLDQHVQPSPEAIIEAVTKRNYRAIELLFFHGWDINKALGPTQPPVLSMSVQDMEMATWLLDKGADPNASCDVDCTSLSMAVQTAEYDMINLLLGRGGDLQRGSLMHYAVWRRPVDLNLVYNLARLGTPCDDVIFQDQKSIRLRGHFQLGTPLHEVCQGNVVVARPQDTISVASILLTHGANPDKRKLQHGRAAGLTPREITSQKADYSMLQLFDIPIGLQRDSMLPQR